MHYADDRYHLRVEFHAKGCNIPADELTRMQRGLDAVGEVVQDFPSSELSLDVIHHPRSGVYHVEATLKVPGKTLLSGDHDAYLDSAFQRCVRKLVQKATAYRDNPDRDATEAARRRETLDREIVAPQGPTDGTVGRAVEAGDYRAFRTALSGYEEWLRLRVGRWIQRYPQAEARVGDGILIGDLLEEVYLNAFEGYGKRPKDVSLSEWLDSLLDPSLRLLLKYPDEERENASLARTLRETPL